LLVGAEKSDRSTEDRWEIDHFTARLVVLSFDDAAAAHAAEIRAHLERRGQAMGGYDTLITGHAAAKAWLS
jgi:tRNA(fMet)-specific endonuclease VapC